MSARPGPAAIAALGALVVVLFLAGLGWALTRAPRVGAEALAGLQGDPVRGEYVFRAAGCADCHAGTGENDAGALKLGGGREVATDLGISRAPNISPSANGIGDWSDADLANALLAGVRPDGSLLMPFAQHTAFARMTPADAVSLRAWLATLPVVDTPSVRNRARFPFSLPRFAGLRWRSVARGPGWWVAAPPEAATGRYLAEALAACGACHTPRGMLGGYARNRWLAGAIAPGGEAAPDLTPAALGWSEADLIAFFRAGIRPDFTTAGGSMAPVIARLGTLPDADLVSLAAYLGALTPR